MAPLMRKLRVVGGTDDRLNYEAHVGTMQAAHAALAEIEEMGAKKAVHADVVEDLEREYHERVEQAEAAIRGMHLELQAIRAEKKHRA